MSNSEHQPTAGTETSSLQTSTSIKVQVVRRHPASLIPRNLHDPLLLGLLKAPVNDELIEYVAERTQAVVSTPSDSAQLLPTPPATPVKSTFRRTLSRTLRHASSSISPSVAATTTPTKQACLSPESASHPNDVTPTAVPCLTTFIKLTASRANAQAPTLLVTLVYLDRLRERLKGAKAAKGMQCTYHRLFLACLIAAAKYCNDCCPRNSHWVKWSGLFTLNEVNLMEQELLMLLDHELRVDESDLLLMCEPFLPNPLPSTTHSKNNNNNIAMERQALSSTSLAPTNSTSSDSQVDDQITTPSTSPVVIRVDNHEHVERKKPKLIGNGPHHHDSAVTRAKSWYGSLRTATL